MWIEVPMTPLIYDMLQEALLFNLQIMIQDLSILINARDLLGTNKTSLCYHRLGG